MEMTKKMLFKICPAVVGFFTLVLTLQANSSGCFIVHQPKVPAKLDEFKKIR